MRNVDLALRVYLMNDALHQVIESIPKKEQGGNCHGGRLYLVLDPATGGVGTTNDKNLSSPMRDVVSALNELSEEILDNKNRQLLTREQIDALENKMMILIEKYKNKKRRIFDRITYYIYNFVTSLLSIYKNKINYSFSKRKVRFENVKEGEGKEKTIFL